MEPGMFVEYEQMCVINVLTEEDMKTSIPYRCLSPFYFLFLKLPDVTVGDDS